MRKELPIELQAERVRLIRDNEMYPADRVCAQWSSISYAGPWGSKEPLFRVHAFEELVPEIDAMAGEIQRLSGSGMTSAEEVLALGTFLEQLRLMAIEEERGAGSREGTCPELRDGNLELETMISILRNDLDEIAMRACA